MFIKDVKIAKKRVKHASATHFSGGEEEETNGLQESRS